MKILANDGIDAAGRDLLEAAGFEVNTTHYSPEEILNIISDFDVLLVRSATKVSKEVMDAGQLKVIGRAGVGMDNIDLNYAAQKGIAVYNTPSASSTSVAELVFAHLLGLCRNLPKTNRVMPEYGDTQFNALKKESSSGSEIFGKTIGIIGFGRIGQEVARIALGCGMKVLAHDPFVRSTEVSLSMHPFHQTQEIKVHIETIGLDELLANSDYVTLHLPGKNEPVLSASKLELMKEGAGLINCARGGVVDEKALLKLLENGKIKFAGLDVFEQEPPVFMDILKNPKVSLSPHIGASTSEAQWRVGVELANRVIQHFQSSHA